MAIARRIDFLRETTSLALALHTDPTNQETPPGYQFRHCITNHVDRVEYDSRMRRLGMP